MFVQIPMLFLFCGNIAIHKTRRPFFLSKRRTIPIEVFFQFFFDTRIKKNWWSGIFMQKNKGT